MHQRVLRAAAAAAVPALERPAAALCLSSLRGQAAAAPRACATVSVAARFQAFATAAAAGAPWRRPTMATATTTTTTTVLLPRQTTTRRGYATPSDHQPVPTPATPLPELSTPLAVILQQAAPSAAPTHPSLYATVHIHGRPYLVTPGDRLRLPFRMARVRPGDELRLDRVGVVGTRSVTAMAAATAGESAAAAAAATTKNGHVPGAAVTAVVLGIETEPLRVMVKTKRRNRRSRTVRSKHQYTVLRIQEVVVGEEA